MIKQFVSKRAALAAAAILCFAVFLINSNARAQSPPCPDSTGPAPNPSVIPWTYDSVYYAVGGSGCYVTAYYCYRDLGTDSTQVWMDGFAIDSNSSCDSSETAGEIDSLGIIAVESQDNVNHGSPCFKAEYHVVSVFNVPCLEMFKFPVPPGFPGIYILRPCWSGEWCEETCDICFNVSDQMQISNCSFSSAGIQTCPTPPSQNWRTWTQYVCYSIIPGCP
jgi:hypothetical protein